MTKELHYTHIEFPATEKVRETPVVIPESFFEALKRERPDGINWERANLAVAVLKGEKDAVTPKPPEPEPTESQKFFREMYRTGKLSPYQGNNRPKINLKNGIEAWKNPQTQGVESKIMALDLALRGGADKEYNQLGDMSKRATRMAVMVGNMVPFTIFDILTSIPGNLFLKGVEIYKARHNDGKGKGNNDQQVRLTTIAGALDGPRRVFEILNDKITTAFGDKLVQTLTGEKGGWIHESSDKTGDFLDGAVGMYYEDAVNGPMVESAMRFMYEIPVFGALVEQGWTKLSAWQEQSPFSKAFGKAIFGGMGTMFGTINKLHEIDKKYLLKEKYKEPKSPSVRISNAIWSVFVKLPVSPQSDFFHLATDAGKFTKMDMPTKIVK